MVNKCRRWWWKGGGEGGMHGTAVLGLVCAFLAFGFGEEGQVCSGGEGVHALVSIYVGAFY